MFSVERTKIIGVLGGYGPFATSDFFKSMLENTEAKKDWEHAHVIIDNNPRIPSRVRAFLYDEESPVPYMKEGIARLANAGAEFFICPCNTAHYFLKKEADLGLPFMDMIEVTLQRILKDGNTNVAILGSEVTIMTKLYEEALIKENIIVQNVKDLADVRKIIEAGKQNKGIPQAKELMLNLINQFKKDGAESVIYACTELPIVLPIAACPLPVYDSSSILAEEAIKFSFKREK